MPIGFHETISAPHMHATCRECHSAQRRSDCRCLVRSATHCRPALCTEAGRPVPRRLPTSLYVLCLQWSCCGSTSLKGHAYWMWGLVRADADLAVGTTVAAAGRRAVAAP